MVPTLVPTCSSASQLFLTTSTKITAFPSHGNKGKAWLCFSFLLQWLCTENLLLTETWQKARLLCFEYYVFPRSLLCCCCLAQPAPSSPGWSKSAVPSEMGSYFYFCKAAEKHELAGTAAKKNLPTLQFIAFPRNNQGTCQVCQQSKASHSSDFLALSFSKGIIRGCDGQPGRYCSRLLGWWGNSICPRPSALLFKPCTRNLPLVLFLHIKA